jgi:hypothetical protein
MYENRRQEFQTHQTVYKVTELKNESVDDVPRPLSTCA